MSTLALLLWISQLGSPVFNEREHALTHLLAKRPTEREWLFFRSFVSADPETEHRVFRVYLRWTKAVCDSCLPEGCTLYPGLDSAYEVRKIYPWEEDAVVRPGELWGFTKNSGEYYPYVGLDPRVDDRKELLACLLRYLHETGDIKTVRDVLQKAHKMELEYLPSSKVFVIFGAPLICSGAIVEYAPELCHTLTR